MRTAALFLSLAACTTDPLAPPTGEVHRHTVTALKVPLTNTDAREQALDLNDDDAIDNQFGMIFSTLAGREVWPGERTAELIASGELVVHADLQVARSSDPDDTIALSMYTGAAASAPPLIAPASPRPLLGPGELSTAIAFYDDVVELDLVGARVQLRTIDPSRLEGIVAGGLRRTEIENELIPSFAAKLEAMIASQCTMRTQAPGCGCFVDGEYGATYFLAAFDASPADCTITPSEIIDSSITQSLLAPDVIIDGEQLLSFGFAFAAMPR